MSLSIFSFKQHQKSEAAEASMPQSTPENAQSDVLVAEKSANQEPQRKMVLDLQNLTPETLEAFFPSERNSAG